MIGIKCFFCFVFVLFCFEIFNIKKRVAYFGCTVAPGGSSSAHAPSELPSFSSPA